MHRRLSGAPAQAGADAGDGVIRHGEEHDLGGIDDALRIAARAARNTRNGVAAARKREREAFAYAALADEPQPLSADRKAYGFFAAFLSAAGAPSCGQ